eukprot:1157779-Pelagomonas_calceolata.AAC.8
MRYRTKACGHAGGPPLASSKEMTMLETNRRAMPFRHHLSLGHSSASGPPSQDMSYTRVLFIRLGYNH